MGTEIGIFFLIVGATLSFAVAKVVDGQNLAAVGIVFMVGGVLGLVVSFVTRGRRRARGSRATVARGRTAV